MIDVYDDVCVNVFTSVVCGGDVKSSHSHLMYWKLLKSDIWIVIVAIYCAIHTHPPRTLPENFLLSARLSVSNSVSGENAHPWADVMQWHVPRQHDVWGQVQARERPSCWYLCWLLLCWINSTPRSPGSRLETPLTVFLGNVNKLCDRCHFSWFWTCMRPQWLSSHIVTYQIDPFCIFMIM